MNVVRSSTIQVPFCEEKSVQLVRVAFFRSDFLQNPYFSNFKSPKIWIRFLFYVLSFFKNGDTIQGGTLLKGGHYSRKYGIFNLIGWKIRETIWWAAHCIWQKMKVWYWVGRWSFVVKLFSSGSGTWLLVFETKKI